MASLGQGLASPRLSSRTLERLQGGAAARVTSKEPSFHPSHTFSHRSVTETHDFNTPGTVSSRQFATNITPRTFKRADFTQA